MINHVWGLMTHPGQEFQQIKREGESVRHMYAHHILLMAAIPVICAFIGTTQVGWNFGDGQSIKLAPPNRALFRCHFLRFDSGCRSTDGPGDLLDGAPL